MRRVRGERRGQDSLQGFIRNRRPGLPPLWKEEKGRNAEEGMSAGGGRAAAERVAGRRGGRREISCTGGREMQRNGSLLCDGLTPANQTGDAEDK